MLISGRAVFLLLMVFVWVGAAWAAPRVFVLTSGKTVQGEVVFVSRDEVTMGESGGDTLFHIPLKDFTLADQTALVQWGRAQMARWSQVVIQFSTNPQIDRSRSGSGQNIKTFLVGKLTVQNRSAQPLPPVKVVTSFEFVTIKTTPAHPLITYKDSPFRRQYGTLDAGKTLEKEIFNFQLKEKSEAAIRDSTKSGNMSGKREAERGFKSLRVSVYVGPELIYHQRVK
jgi:hypothetical protein